MSLQINPPLPIINPPATLGGGKGGIIIEPGKV